MLELKYDVNKPTFDFSVCFFIHLISCSRKSSRFIRMLDFLQGLVYFKAGGSNFFIAQVMKTSFLVRLVKEASSSGKGRIVDHMSWSKMAQ